MFNLLLNSRADSRVGKSHDLKKWEKSDFFYLNQIFFGFKSDFFDF